MHEAHVVKLNKKEYTICVPAVSPPDQLAMTSLMKFIVRFGAKTMMVYDALLSEKRVLMAGQLDFSISSIIEFVLAAAALVPLAGMQTRVFPHVHLKEIGVLLQEPCFVAGVTNPTFLMQKALYDIACEVDVGKLTEKTSELPYAKEAYHSMDSDFINAIVFRIKQNSINDQDIRMAFHSYTRLMLDIAQGACPTLLHKGEPLQLLFANRAKRLRQTQLFRTQECLGRLKQMDIQGGVSLGLCEQRLNQLRYT